MIEYHINIIYIYIYLLDMYHYSVYQDIHIISFARNPRYFFEMSKDVKAQMHLLLIMRCFGWMEKESSIDPNHQLLGSSC